jgi:ADP-ribosylglycohydrolase
MMFRQRPPDRPYPNSYWVEPGLLLAGEYPLGIDATETKERLRNLVACGVKCFVDLTRELEMEPYEPLLVEVTNEPIRHQRFAILDHSIPERPQIIVAALDAIDAAHRRGECVYVHCRAGIGRTAMVVAAYLMRRGLSNEDAFDRLQELWQECARARRWPIVPETDEQIEYVRRWREPGRVDAAHADRAAGALVGLVLADALASAVKSRVLDPTLSVNQRPSLVPFLYSDSGMTVALLESLLEQGQHDPLDQLQRYLAWTRSVQNDPRIVPETLKRALATWQWSGKTYAGSHDPTNLEAHSVARSAAVALYYPAGGERTVNLAAEVSRTTQQAPIVLDVCRAFTAYVLDALLGDPQDVVAAGRGPNVVALTQRMQRDEVFAVIERRARYRRRDASAPAVLDAALRAFGSTDRFEDGLRSLLPPYPTSAAALFGALMGAARGLSDIPQAWRDALPQRAMLDQLVRRLPAP